MQQKLSSYFACLKFRELFTKCLQRVLLEFYFLLESVVAFLQGQYFYQKY